MEGVGGGSVDRNTESRSEVRGDLCCCSDGGETESRGIKKKKTGNNIHSLIWSPRPRVGTGFGAGERETRTDV